MNFNSTISSSTFQGLNPSRSFALYVFDSKMGTEGIEPPSSALEADILPLDYAPKCLMGTMFKTLKSFGELGNFIFSRLDYAPK